MEFGDGSWRDSANGQSLLYPMEYQTSGQAFLTHLHDMEASSAGWLQNVALTRSLQVPCVVCKYTIRQDAKIERFEGTTDS